MRDDDDDDDGDDDDVLTDLEVLPPACKSVSRCSRHAVIGSSIGNGPPLGRRLCAQLGSQDGRTAWRYRRYRCYRYRCGCNCCCSCNCRCGWRPVWSPTVAKPAECGGSSIKTQAQHESRQSMPCLPRHHSMYSSAMRRSRHPRLLRPHHPPLGSLCGLRPCRPLFHTPIHPYIHTYKHTYIPILLVHRLANPGTCACDLAECCSRYSRRYQSDATLSAALAFPIANQAEQTLCRSPPLID